MAPHLKDYETSKGEGDKCPWCGEVIEEIYSEFLECLIQSAIDQETTNYRCGNCGAELRVEFLFVPLADKYSASVEFEVEATVKVA
jgi:DNA-directed RNA polymerase subunit RPC12/RpoP